MSCHSPGTVCNCLLSSPPSECQVFLSLFSDVGGEITPRFPDQWLPLPEASSDCFSNDTTSGGAALNKAYNCLNVWLLSSSAVLVFVRVRLMS